MAGMVFTSCEDDDSAGPKAEINSFAIVNAGANGETTVEGTVEATSITVDVPYKTDVTQLVPEIEVSNNATVTPSSGDTLDFTQPRNFVVTNGDAENTYQVTVNKQDPTGPVLKSLDVTSVTTENKYETTLDQGAAEVMVTYNELQTSVVVLKNVEVGPEGATYATSTESDTMDISSDQTLTVSYGGETQDYTITGNVTAAGFDPATVETVMDKSAASQAVPTEIEDNNSRGAAFNGQYVFVPSRANGPHVYYWDVTSTVDEVKELAGIDQVTGGTWKVSDVVTQGDAIYVSNMVMNSGGVFKVYKWESVDDDAPEVVLEYEVTADNQRFGDAISVIGDLSQDGFIAVSNFPGFGGEADNNNFYVWQASGGEMPAEPAVWDVQVESGANLGQYGRVSAIPGVSDRYLVTGAEMGITVVNGNGEAQFEVPKSLIQSRSFDPHVFEYNGGTYLSYTINRGWEANGAWYSIVNITEGADAVEGLSNLNASNFASKKVYEKNFSGDADAWVSAINRVGFDSNGDPMVMAFTTLNGFIVEKFSK
jgi:hypothetical protein